MKIDKEKDILYVKTFGGFSLTWKGKALTGGAKSSESQFTYLLEYLLHNYKTGVDRGSLEEVIFGDREISNVHHAMQSVIYNTKKKLRQMGLPDVNYIELRKGTFYWTDRIPVCEDAAQFEKLCEAAKAEQDLDRKKDLFQEACFCYGGEYLARQSSQLWAAQEARRYREMFCTCMEGALVLMRVSGDFLAMEELGLHASKVQPLSDWEVVTMEALVSLRRYEDARKLYEETADYYFREEGLRPSKKLMEMLNRLGEQMSHHYAVLDEIQTKLSGASEPGGGGYFCSYPVFQGVYRMVERMMERGGQSVYLMLCTVVDSKGNPMREGNMLEELSERLGKAIQHSVRHSDAITRYGKGQYLVLLVNTTRENCGIIQRRINYHFLVGRQRTGIQYFVNSVVCTPDHPGGTEKFWEDKGGMDTESREP